MEMSPDIHICGFCKQQYNNYEVFLAHKQNGCQIPTTEISVTNAGTADLLLVSLASGNPGIKCRIHKTFGKTLKRNSVQDIPLLEALQACVPKIVKKSMKTQKSPSKKLKPALTQKRHICNFSGCTFKTQYGQKDMERHMLTHTGERPFECDRCHKRFSRRDKLNLHSRSHTGEKPHKCKLCTYAAADSSSLKKHLRVHYDERPFKCQICPYASRNSSQLTVHLRSHTGDAPFQCAECGAKFKINSDLKRHARVHSGEKPYACDLCDYRCAMKANLKSHTRLRHGTYTCTECDFRCAAKAALRAHSRQHAPAHPLRCTRCPYSCTNKGALKRHERVHSDERPFACHFCPFASKQHANLLAHMRKCHGEKVGDVRGKMGRGGAAGEDQPGAMGSRYRVRLEAAQVFCCDLCDASFVREDSLRSHKWQHNNAQKQQSIAQGDEQTRPSNVVEKKADKAEEQVSLTLTNGSVPSYGSTQLKIIVAPPLSQGDTFIQTEVDMPSSKSGTVLLSSEGQNVILNPLIQQVSLLTPVQPEGNLEHQTVLLTHISASDENLLQTTVSPQVPLEMQNFITSASSSENSHMFITTCSDLDSLHALIQQGGAKVSVVTEGHASITTATAKMNSGFEQPSQVVLKRSVDGNPDGGLVMSDLNMEPSSSLVVQNVPLSISAHDQQAPSTIYHLSPNPIFSDSNTADSNED